MKEYSRKLNRYLEFILNLFFIFFPVTLYVIIRSIISTKLPTEILTGSGLTIFNILFIITLFFLVGAKMILSYFKDSKYKIHNLIVFKIIIPIVLIAIIIFELFLTK